MSVREWFQEQSNIKLAAGGLVIAGIAYLILFNPHDQEYLEKVGEEIRLARLICENSVDWVYEDPERLKLEKNVLDHIRVNGRPAKLEHVKYPRAIFLHSGFKHPGAKNEFYCTFSDPRSTGTNYYYDYATQSWIDKTHSRR